MEVISAVDDMAALMSWADMAVSAAGSTCWELAFMGLPSLLLVLSPDQTEIARGMERAQAAIRLGQDGSDIMPGAIGDLAVDEVARLLMSERCRALIDGRGCARVVAAMGSGGRDVSYR